MDSMIETPRLEIDRSIGAAYIRLSDEPVARTAELARNIQVDVDANGTAVGVELLNWPAVKGLSGSGSGTDWRPDAAVYVAGPMGPAMREHGGSPR